MTYSRTKYFLFLFFALIFFGTCTPQKSISPQQEGLPSVLVFSKTAGYRHASIETGIEAIKKLGIAYRFNVRATENSAAIQQGNLKKYDAVIFLNTTENVLDSTQETALQQFIQSGKGFVGIHAAADTEHDCNWYGQMIGGYFNGHPNNPNVREATLNVLDFTHNSTKMLDSTWLRSDEWYNYRFVNRGALNVLINLDETSYEGGTNGRDHPIAWYHEFEGGRVFYTGGGHTKAAFAEPLFLKHLAGGILYAIGK